MVDDFIRDNPSTSDETFPGPRPERYCDRLLNGMWGGGIELSILSEIFKVEICSVDVKTGTAYRFGEQVSSLESSIFFLWESLGLVARAYSQNTTRTSYSVRQLLTPAV